MMYRTQLKWSHPFHIEAIGDKPLRCTVLLDVHKVRVCVLNVVQVRIRSWSGSQSGSGLGLELELGSGLRPGHLLRCPKVFCLVTLS